MSCPEMGVEWTSIQRPFQDCMHGSYTFRWYAKGRTILYGMACPEKGIKWTSIQHPAFTKMVSCPHMDVECTYGCVHHMDVR